VEINLDNIRKKIVDELPSKIRWYIEGEPLDFDFSWAQFKLDPVSKSFMSCTIEEEWNNLFVIGDQDYSEGGGATPAITVNSNTGEIFGFDVERSKENIIFFINTDIDKYIESFNLFDEVLRAKNIHKSKLENKLRKIDPNGYDKSDWLLLAKHIIADTASD